MNPQDYPSVDYQNNSPLNYDHKIIMGEWNPIGTYNQNLGSGDVVRFNIQSEDFWDPYSAYIEVTVDISGNPLLANDANITNKIIQIDGCSHSLFKNLIVYHGNDELERIGQYDVLMNMLKDLSTNVDDRYVKGNEAYGGTHAQSFANGATQFWPKPILNDGNLKPTQGYRPIRDITRYTDDNAVFDQNPTLNYTTRNHSYQYQQNAFQPFLNTAGVTWANTAQENAMNFAETDGTVSFYSANDAGLHQAYNPSFGGSAFEPWLSQTVPTRYLKNGFIKVDAITSFTFHIPLMSGIFGQLVHPKAYKLIPMKYFTNLMFEFQFNEHAFFTSFHSSNNAARNYTVKKMVMHAELIQVREQSILQNLEGDYQRGIRIPLQSFYLGPLYSITQGAVPPTVQVNLGFSSLKSLLFCFIPNDYTANSGCRKQYRLSMALTQLQIKIGTDYYPQLPVRGNAGNNVGVINNNEFIKHLFKCFNKHIGFTNSVINQHNFALNCRAFDPTSSDAVQTSDIQGGFFEENRVIGKSCFGICLDSLNYENKLLSGVNTMSAKPFEIQLQYDASKTFSRPVTMYTFCQYDFVLEISPNGIKSLGKS